MEALLPAGIVEFTVYGTPAPKGSKSAFAIRKGGVLTGRTVLTERSSGAQREWTQRVREVIQGRSAGYPLIEGPLHVELRFSVPKPKSARKSVVWPAKRPDLDKLSRLLLDAMTGCFYVDDSQVCSMIVTKHYGIRPGVDVRLWPLEEVS
jgi:Holliday junction resolvase RusA-like endonuclease